MPDKIRIASVNMTEKGSTGKIMLNIANLANKKGMESLSFSTCAYSPNHGEKIELETHKYYGWYAENTLHTVLGKVSGYNGCFSYFGTLQLIRNLKKFKPDILHLHNLHQFCINLPVLFRYIKKNNIKVVWTLHDCWSFTGHCPHFTIAKCEKWKTGCYNCPQYGKYPKTYVDRSKSLYKLKKKWFCGVDNMTIVTPSKWLADLVGQSYLGGYPIKVMNNGIDLSVFHPMESEFSKKYGCEGKKIILGVSFAWGYSKGLDVFVELSKRLPEDYQIILVGTNDSIDSQLPKNIISIHKTNNQKELAEIYSIADVFVNPTREDTFPTVNMEAIACGTPVVTFKTGGSPETVPDGCGEVVDCDDIDAMTQKIKEICEKKNFEREFLWQQAQKFDMNDCFLNYVNLYEELMKPQ